MIVVSFSESGCIAYVPKRENIKGYMNYNKYKAMMVVYAENHTRNNHKLYNPGGERVIMSRDIK